MLRTGRLLAVLLVASALAPHVAGGRARPADPPPVRWMGLAARDGFGFFGRSDGLVVLDLRDPARPRQVGFVDVDHAIHGVTLDGSTAYLAGGTGGLWLVDVSDPAAPAVLSRWDSLASVRDTAVAGAFAFVADHRDGLSVLDLTEPASPRRRVRVATRGELHGLALHGDLLATAEGLAGLRFIDVSRPHLARDGGRAADSEGARDVVTVGPVVLVAAAKRGVLAYTPQPRGTARPLARVATPGPALALARLGVDSAVVACGASGLSVVRWQAGGAGLEVVSELLLPRSRPALDVAVDGDRAYVSSGVGGFALVDLGRPEAPEILLPHERRMRVRFP